METMSKRFRINDATYKRINDASHDPRTLQDTISQLSDEEAIWAVEHCCCHIETFSDARLDHIRNMLASRSAMYRYNNSNLDYGRSPSTFVSYVQKYEGVFQHEMLKELCKLGHCPNECLAALDELALTLPDAAWSVVEGHLSHLEHVHFEPQTDRLRRAMAFAHIRSSNLGRAAEACVWGKVDPCSVPQANPQLLQLRALFKQFDADK